MTENSTPGTDAHVEDAGAFDIRRFIGGLIGLMGIILVLMGIFAHSPADLEKTGGINANLWTGIAMVIAAIVFEVWAKVDPIRILVQENEPGAEESRDLSAVD